MGLVAGSVCIVTLKLVIMCFKTQCYHNNLHDVFLSSLGVNSVFFLTVKEIKIQDSTHIVTSYTRLRM